HVALTELEAERLGPVVALVEHGAILGTHADVVHEELVAGRRRASGAGAQHRDLERVRQRARANRLGLLAGRGVGGLHAGGRRARGRGRSRGGRQRGGRGGGGGGGHGGADDGRGSGRRGGGRGGGRLRDLEARLGVDRGRRDGGRRRGGGGGWRTV